MHKFIVMGSFFDAMAHLHCLAENEEHAIQKWKNAFGDKVKGFDVSVVDVDNAKPNCLVLDWSKEWKDGYQYFYGGYDPIADLGLSW